MKILLCYLFIVSLCFCFSDSVDSETYLQDYQYAYEPQHEHQDNIFYPCSVHDTSCIQEQLSELLICTPGYDHPEPYIIKMLEMALPQANATFTINDAQVKGLSNWNVKEFFINKEKDVLVLELEFDKVKVYSPKSEIAYYRRGKEPLQVTDYSSIEFDSLSLTLTVKNLNKIGLGLAKFHVHSYLSGSIMPLFGSGLSNIQDPIEVNARKAMLDGLGLTLLEAFVAQGPVFMNFALRNLCSRRKFY